MVCYFILMQSKLLVMLKSMFMNWVLTSFQHRLINSTVQKELDSSMPVKVYSFALIQMVALKKMENVQEPKMLHRLLEWLQRLNQITMTWKKIKNIF